MRKPFLLLALLALASCKKDIDFGYQEGITYRDGSNLPAGPSDPTDWTSDATWNKPEQALFADLKLNLNGPQLAGIQSNSAYPNPVTTRFNWGLSGSLTNYSLRAALVDEQYKVRQRLAVDNKSQSTLLELDLAGLSLPKNQTYRLYYVVYTSGGLVYKGHGDLRYNN